jgi:altronate hydrolase
MGHQEFVLTYKSFEPIGPACMPVVGVSHLAQPTSWKVPAG